MRDLYYSFGIFRGAVVTIIFGIIVAGFYIAISLVVSIIKQEKSVHFEEEEKMRTARTDNGTTYHVNGDWSGDLIVILPQEAVEAATGGNCMVTIPMETLKTVMADYLRSRTISNFEQMTNDEILDYAIVGHETDSDEFQGRPYADFLRDGQCKS